MDFSPTFVGPCLNILGAGRARQTGQMYNGPVGILRGSLPDKGSEDMLLKIHRSSEQGWTAASVGLTKDLHQTSQAR